MVERQDLGAQLPNGAVEFLHHLVGQGFVDALAAAQVGLEHHADREDPLHGQIVQVARDTVAILLQQQAFAVAAQLFVLQRERQARRQP